MDSVIEYMVKKEKDPQDTMKKAGIIAAALVLSVLSFMFLNALGFLGAAIVLFFAYRFIMGLDLEFEYCLVGADIDVDKIMNKSRRKRMISIDGKDIEVVAPVDSDEVKQAERKDMKTYFAAARRNDAGNYAIIGGTPKGYVEIIVQLDDRMKSQFKRTIPRKFIES